jgi:hypothetical protein
MIVGIKLGPSIKCEKICYQIQQLINNYQQSNSLEDSILVIKISTIKDSTDSQVINLEYKN